MANQDWINRDFYKALGLNKNATSDNIKKSYQKLSKKYHPDLNNGDKEIEKKYKDINEAYTVLSNTKTRQEYDTIRQYGGQSSYKMPPYSSSNRFNGDVFNNFFENQNNNFNNINFENLIKNKSNKYLRLQTTISFEEAINGGQISLVDPYYGSSVKIRIPKGIKDGQVIKVARKNNDNLLIRINIRPHKLFSRKNNDIYITVPINFHDLVLGGQIYVPTINGEKLKIKIPKGTSSTKIFRLKGKGVFINTNKAGDMFVAMQVLVPQEISHESEKILKTFVNSIQKSTFNKNIRL